MSARADTWDVTPESVVGFGWGLISIYPGGIHLNDWRNQSLFFLLSFFFFPFHLPLCYFLCRISNCVSPRGKKKTQKQSLVKLTRTSWKGGAAPSAASSENSWDSTLPPYHCCDSVIAWWSRNEFCLLVAVSRCIVGSLIEFPLCRWLTLKHSTINTWFETKNLERKLDESDCPFGWIYHTIVSCFFFSVFIYC